MASKSIKRPTFKRSYSSNLDIASRQSASLIIEFGSAIIRVGIAGEPKPRHLFVLPHEQAKPKEESNDDKSDSDIDNNNNNNNNKHESKEYWTSLSSIPSLVQRRNSSDSVCYDDLLPWLSDLYTRHLLLKPRSRRVVLLLPIHHPPQFKSTLESILLDQLQVPSVLFVDSFRTIPYAIGGCGSNTGMIVDLGRVEGRVVCFFNGLICEDTLQIVPVGFRSLMDQVKSTSGDDMYSTKDVDLLNELYFDLDNPNTLIYSFLSSLKKCPIDVRKHAVKSIVFVGGGVEAISQFEQRFMQCIKGLFELDDDDSSNITMGMDHASYRVKNHEHRRFSSLANVVMRAPLGIVYPLQFRPSCVSWVGGSIWGSMKLSGEKWIHRNDQKSS